LIPALALRDVRERVAEAEQTASVRQQSIAARNGTVSPW
jgi:hypothetical protein